MASLEKKHGREIYFLIDDKGFKPNREKLEKENFPLVWVAAMVRDSSSESLQEKDQFRFGRMFKIKADIPLSRKGIDELGLAMIQPKDHQERTNLPAGYTFLGQFIDHDMSFDSLRKIPTGEGEVRDPVKIL